MLNLTKILNEKILLFDGATGTMLQQHGLMSGELPELLNLSKPEIVTAIHREYVLAGSDVVSSNTFQANELKLGAAADVEAVVSAGVRCAKDSGARYAALDVGPLGQLMAPMGTLSFERAYEVFRRQILAGEKAGADAIIIETFSDLYEMKAALLAAKENTVLPVICSMTFQEEGRTFIGCDALTATVTLQNLGADAIGVNCSLGPEKLAPVVETMLKYSRVPVIMQANAGLPVMRGDKPIYELSPEEYVSQVIEMVGKGVGIVGGCCGTNPEYIRLLRERTEGLVPARRVPERITACSSGTKTVIIDGAVQIGERLKADDTDLLIDEALTQTAEGASIIEIFSERPDIDEPRALSDAVTALQSVTGAPLMLDSSSSTAIEAAARVYNGIPIINYVNEDRESMEHVYSIAKRYGALLSGLTPGENGISEENITV